MKRVLLISFLALSIGFIYSLCQGQITGENSVRLPARAGQFYPGSKDELQKMINSFLKQAKKVDVNGDIVGIWAPHAGYVFCGQVAAAAYRLVQGHKFDAVIIIGPSHYVYFKGASIGDWSAYRTPLGDAVVDTQLVQKIRSLTPLVSCIPKAHQYEHSVEVQIPFIQTVLPGVPIVPVVIGQLSYKDSKKLADAIVKAVGSKKVLLVASSDMSHYPNYKNACKVDQKTLDTIAAFNPKKVLSTSRSVLKKGIENLECTLCGETSVITVMLASKELGADKVKVLTYANSGDVSGERDRVVGYGTVVFYHKFKKVTHGGKKMLDEIVFSKEEKKKLFNIARQSIIAALKREKIPEFSVTEPNLLLKRGVFVTLMNHGRLRGCIGHFEADFPLYQIASQMAVAAATQDYRFMYNPVTLDEMDQIDIKISILSALKKINSIDEIKVGKHGIWIRQGMRSGTYLPEVATEMGWNKIEFLEHCCVEKAGLPKDAWKKGADIYIYTSQVLDEHE